MSGTIIYAVHGFLGQAADWELIKKKLPDCRFVSEELFSKNPAFGLDELAKLPATKKIFLGYSFGGRAGLSLLKHNPEVFDHYVFLSTHPGLREEDAALREKRLEVDRIWAEKISEKNWTAFLQEWNAQAVFSDSVNEPVRDLSHFDLQKLKDALLTRSLGLQEDYSEVIRKLKSKITWVVGSRDPRYCGIAEELKSREILSGYERISAGHRIWLDRPDDVVELLNNIIRQ